MRFRIQSFREYVERGDRAGAGAPVSSISGEIDGDDFCLAFDDIRLAVPVAEHGDDYVVVEEGRREFPSGLAFEIRLETPEGPEEEPGCEMRFFKLESPIEFSLSVHFDASGRCDGSGIAFKGTADDLKRLLAPSGREPLH